MACRRYASTLDHHGPGAMPDEVLGDLARHLAGCADCRGEKRERDVVHLALEVGGHGPVSIPADLVERILEQAPRRRERNRRLAADPLRQVALVGRHWVPRLAAAALLFVSVSVALLSVRGFDLSSADEAIAAIVVAPDSPLAEDLLFEAILSIGGLS